MGTGPGALSQVAPPRCEVQIDLGLRAWALELGLLTSPNVLKFEAVCTWPSEHFCADEDRLEMACED